MIYKLRRKFIRIAAASVISVLAAIFVIAYVININQLNSTMDALTDMIADNHGRLPDMKDMKGSDNGKPMDKRQDFRFMDPKGGINKEASLGTRFFSVKLNDAGEVIECNIDRIASVDEEGAKEYVKSVLATNTGKGWYDSYRYKVVKLEGESLVIMVDGSMNQTMTRNSLWALLAALAGCGALVILLIVIFSKRAVKPVAESYEKQKQFITDANHELKTPLTLILADLEIAEAELGKSEWLDDIRVESEQMTTLVNKLVTLSRMDEDGTKLNMAKFNLSDAIYDSASDFERAISASGRSLELSVPEKVMYNGDEAAIRQLLSILLDNARKYCDDEGEILVTLTNGHRPCISVANSFKEVKNTELDRLFDRFYRSDKARTSGSGYGIGLSIAKAIVEKHGGKISANKLNGDKIVFRAVL